MNNFFRALIAGYGAKKLGGGCLGTVLVFIIIWVALGECSCIEKEQEIRSRQTTTLQACMPGDDLTTEEVILFLRPMESPVFVE